MTYKMKSLLYFVCFVISAFTYYGLDNNQNNEQEYAAIEVEALTNDVITPAVVTESENLN
jgi:hypothetical protein